MQIYELFKRKQNHKMNFIESAHKNIRRLTFTISLRTAIKNQKTTVTAPCLLPFSPEAYSEYG